LDTCFAARLDWPFWFLFSKKLSSFSNFFEKIKLVLFSFRLCFKQTLYIAEGFFWLSLVELFRLLKLLDKNLKIAKFQQKFEFGEFNVGFVN